MKRWIVPFALILTTPLLSLIPEEEHAYIEQLAERTEWTFSEYLPRLANDVVPPEFIDEVIQIVARLEKEKFTGQHVENWSNGQQKFRISMINGVVNCHFHGYYENGHHAFKGHFDHGKLRGIHIAFHPYVERYPKSRVGRMVTLDGQGKLNDRQHRYYQAPKRECLEANYLHGKLHGRVVYFDEARVSRVERYEHGSKEIR